MIAVLLGTHPQPFTRALTLATQLAAGEPMVVQHGHTTPPAKIRATERYVEMLEFEALRDLVELSDVVVCHGGVGSIYLALDAGRRPIVIPRLRRFAEHVDDHQVQITERLARDGLVVPCLPGTDIRSLRGATGSRPRRVAPVALRAAVWAAAPLLPAAR